MYAPACSRASASSPSSLAISRALSGSSVLRRRLACSLEKKCCRVVDVRTLSSSGSMCPAKLDKSAGDDDAAARQSRRQYARLRPCALGVDVVEDQQPSGLTASQSCTRLQAHIVVSRIKLGYQRHRQRRKIAPQRFGVSATTNNSALYSSRCAHAYSTAARVLPMPPRP